MMMTKKKTMLPKQAKRTMMMLTKKMRTMTVM